jgi:CheY-like chemotaxis protein
MSPERILVVEDEIRVAQALSRVLSLPEGGGHAVETCESGEAALERLEQNKFDLVITDLRMPGMSGLDLLEHVHRISPQTRTVLITAYGTPQIEERAKELADAYVPKPFNMQGFVRMVRQILSVRPPEPQRLIAFSESGLRAVETRIEGLRADLGGLGALLFDHAGNMIVESGRHGEFNLNALLVLLSAAMSASLQVNYALQDEASFALHFHEGKNYQMYTTSLNDQLFLTLIFDRQSATAGRVGMIWTALRRAIAEIRDMMERATLAGNEPSPITPSMPSMATPPASQLTPTGELAAPTEASPVISEPSSTLSYEQARALGLINLDDLETL